MKDQSLALLINRLQVPLIARGVLEQDGPMAGDMGYTLHAMLSDMRPDTALLAIAATAQTCVAAMKRPTPGDAVLHGLSSRIIEDYTPRWLASFGDEAAAQGALLENLGRIESDLLSLHDLLKTAAALQKDENIAALLHILDIQSGAQADIVAEFLNLMECEFMQGETLFPVQAHAFRQMEEDSYSDLEMDACRYDTPSNVVSFPAGF
jgi:hypothetical protein